MPLEHPNCDNCDETDAEITCIQCNASLCKYCDQKRHSKPAAAHHLRHPIDIEIEKLSRLCSVKDHEDIPLSLFCQTCFIMICSNCILKDHRIHTCLSLKEAVESLKIELNDSLIPVQAQIEKTKDEIKKLKEEIKNKEAILQHKFQLVTDTKEVIKKSELDAFTFVSEVTKLLKREEKSEIFILHAPLESSPYRNCNGVFHFIGTGHRKRRWQNPHTDGHILVTSTGQWQPTIALGYEVNLVDTLESGRRYHQDIYVNGVEISVDLKEYRLDVTHYAMKNGGGRGLVLTDWTFDAKVNPTDSWEVLRTHMNDTTYEKDGYNGFGLHVFEIENSSSTDKRKFYRFFRINRTNGECIYIHRLEFYGRLKKEAM